MSLQAPEKDVEGCILHVGENGEPEAILCRGFGSFESKLSDIKSDEEDKGPNGSKTGVDEVEAATV